MRTPSYIAVLALASLTLAAPARASLIGASLDVQFNSPGLTADYGSVILGAVPSVFDTPYAYITVSATQLTIGVPSYDTGTFSFPAGSSFTGFIFSYGNGATVTGDSFDATNGLVPTGLLNLYPLIGVNLTGDVLHSGAPIVLDVTGTYTAPPAVPEPASLALLAPALACLGLARRRAVQPSRSSRAAAGAK